MESKMKNKLEKRAVRRSSGIFIMPCLMLLNNSSVAAMDLPENNQPLRVRIINVATSCPLDVDGVQTHIPHNGEGNRFQHWILRAVDTAPDGSNYYKLINVAKNVPLDVDGLQYHRPHNGDGNRFQQWYLRPLPGNVFKLINRQTNLPLDKHGEIQRTLKHNGDSNQYQQWYLRVVN
jgi:hypothetical protein